MYHAAFIVPVGAKKILGDDGWMFESSSRLSLEIRDHLIESLNLCLFESYLGIEKYIDSTVTMSVIYDDQNEIESIHFQLDDGTLTILSKACRSGNMPAGAELFLPQCPSQHTLRNWGQNASWIVELPDIGVEEFGIEDATSSPGNQAVLTLPLTVPDKNDAVDIGCCGVILSDPTDRPR